MASKKRRKKKRRGHYHTGVYTSPKALGECRYRSGWELAYMKHLDADPEVVSYLYEGVKIPYVANVRTGRLRTYYPDLLIKYANGSEMLVEIKPSKRVMQANVQKKLKAAETWCAEHGISLRIITEVQLKAMGLL